MNQKMEYKTRISKIENNDITIRGEKLSSLVAQNSFSQNIFFLLFGKKATEQEAHIFDKILSCIIDHGMGTNSAQTTRFVASAGNEINVAVGAGVLSLGNFHGGSIENAMKQFYSWEKSDNPSIIIEDMITNKKTLFGFGHKHYKNGDPRVTILKKEMKKIEFKSKYVKYIDMVETSFVKIKGKAILSNVDGLIATILCDFGASPLIGKGIFIIGRTPGLVAQSFEEIKYEKPVRRVPEDLIEYISEK